MRAYRVPMPDIITEYFCCPKGVLRRPLSVVAVVEDLTRKGSWGTSGSMGVKDG